jgi:hypothetical protein
MNESLSQIAAHERLKQKKLPVELSLGFLSITGGIPVLLQAMFSEKNSLDPNIVYASLYSTYGTPSLPPELSSPMSREYNPLLTLIPVSFLLFATNPKGNKLRQTVRDSSLCFSPQ